ncbi:hypothetical protein [Myroides sp. LJL116]
MKNIIIVAILLLLNLSCKNRTDQVQNENLPLKENKTPLEKEISYGIEVNAPIAVTVFLMILKLLKETLL